MAAVDASKDKSRPSVFDNFWNRQVFALSDRAFCFAVNDDHNGTCDVLAEIVDDICFLVIIVVVVVDWNPQPAAS